MSAATPSSLKEYLKKYESGGGAGNPQKKKRKKKSESRPKASVPGGVLIVDEDPAWQKPVNVDGDGEGDHSSDDEAAVVEEDIEVKRLKRLQMLQAKKPYYSLSEDGSGWVSVANTVDGGGGMQDLSPVRRRLGQRQFDTPSPEPDGVARDDQDQDLSPPRKGRHDSPELESARMPPDMSPPRRRRKRSSDDDDFSPSRHVSRSLGPHDSPGNKRPDSRKQSTRKGRHDSPELESARMSPDMSPPRRRRRKASLDDDFSPSRHISRSLGHHGSPENNLPDSLEADHSPPRRNRRGSVDNDLSPARRSRSSPSLLHDEIAGSEEDLSPPRKNRRISHSDNSPPRRKGMQRFPPSLNGQRPSTAALPPLPNSKALSSIKEGGKRGGLYTGSEIKEVIDKKKAEDNSRLAALDHSKSGLGAEPVYRIKGKRVTKEEKMKLEKGEEKKEDVKLEWGKGIAQKREAETRAKELEIEKEKPFARTRDDPELDNMFKERLRWGDPMAHLVKKKHSDTFLEDFGEDEKMKESGFMVPQNVPSHSWIKRRIEPPPNRYNIKPGRHWDGVDRSTGYEKELFKRQNEKKATQTEAYLWSVSDM